MSRKPNPDTEKLSKQVVFVLQPSLFDAFERLCLDRYKSVSEALREMIVAAVQQVDQE